MSTRRLEALINVAIRGLSETEDLAEDPFLSHSYKPEVQAAQEAIWYLNEWLEEMKAQ
jgi:hypothetical protein